jgi:hypothetical protein
MPQIQERKQLTVPKIESPEGYYEEAEPYDTSVNGMCQWLGPGGGLTALTKKSVVTIQW